MSAANIAFKLPVGWKVQPFATPENAPTGVAEFDRLFGGLPKATLSEICGQASSGRTSLVLSALAEATWNDEVCAYVDAHDTFHPHSAAAAGVALDRLLWVRCGGDVESALKAADLLVQAGGFGMIVLDIANAGPETTRRIPTSVWFRLQRAVEPTRMALVVLSLQPNARTAASLIVEMKAGKVAWSGGPGCSDLLRGIEVQAAQRKPIKREGTAGYRLSAVG